MASVGARARSRTTQRMSYSASMPLRSVASGARGGLWPDIGLPGALRCVVARSGDGDDFEVMEMEHLENPNMEFEEEDDEAVDTGLDIIALEDLDHSEAQLTAVGRDADAGSSRAGWSKLEEVDFLIDETKFHRLRMDQCSFYIKMAPDKDGNVFDFREVGSRPFLFAL